MKFGGWVVEVIVVMDESVLLSELAPKTISSFFVHPYTTEVFVL